MMRLLGLEFCSLDDVAAWLGDRERRPGKPTALTFDDGYADVYHHAFPLLAEHRIPAVMFVVAQRRFADWAEDEGREPLALADWGQMREMAAAGMTFGSHTLTHAHLTRCDDAQLAAETADSKKLIEDTLGMEIRHFSYPYGGVDERVVEAVRKAGYRTACTTVKKAVRPGADLLRLPRLTVGKRMGAFRFLLRVMVRH